MRTDGEGRAGGAVASSAPSISQKSVLPANLKAFQAEKRVC